MEYILIFISAIFVNNIVLSQFLGICPFLGVSKKVETALGMSAAVAFVLTIATIVTFLVQKYVLDAGRIARVNYKQGFVLRVTQLVDILYFVLPGVQAVFVYRVSADVQYVIIVTSQFGYFDVWSKGRNHQSDAVSAVQ